MQGSKRPRVPKYIRDAVRAGMTPEEIGKLFFRKQREAGASPVEAACAAGRAVEEAKRVRR